MARRRSNFLAALAARATEHAVQGAGPARIGRPGFLGRGLDYAAYLLDVEQETPDGGETWRQVVARVPPRETSAVEQETARREARLLERLGEEARAFRVPDVLGLVALEGRLVMVQSACHGVALRPRASESSEPWQVIADVAAAIHATNTEAWGEDTIGPKLTRRESILSRCADVAPGTPEALDAALGFVQANLPPEEPGVLLHGDLLPQNLCVDPVGGDPPAVLDWNYACIGDPAWDLAVVTRGVRRPFGLERGAELLLDAYNASSSRPIELLALRACELLLRMSLYAHLPDSVSDAQRAEEIQFVQGLLRRSERLV